MQTMQHRCAIVLLLVGLVGKIELLLPSLCSGDTTKIKPTPVSRTGVCLLPCLFTSAVLHFRKHRVDCSGISEYFAASLVATGVKSFIYFLKFEPSKLESSDLVCLGMDCGRECPLDCWIAVHRHLCINTGQSEAGKQQLQPI